MIAIIQHDAPVAEKPAALVGFGQFLNSLDLVQPHDWRGRAQRARVCAEEVIGIADAHLAKLSSD